MRRILTFEHLKWASFTHSAVYLGLLVTVFTGPAGLKLVLGWTHGIAWIVMSLACIAALRLRVIDLRLAVAVAVLGGVGPFIGSYEFVRAGRNSSDKGMRERVSAAGRESVRRQ
jgi:pilus assembly protein TadC